MTTADRPLTVRPRRSPVVVNGRTLPLTAADLAELLPHRGPFALLDRVDEVRPGEWARGRKFLSRNDPMFEGHFPGKPLVPGVLIVEMLGQLSGIVLWSGAAALTSVPGEGEIVGVLAGIKRVRFRRLVEPGEVLDLESTLAGQLGGVSEYTVVARVGSERAVEGSVQIAFRDAPR